MQPSIPTWFEEALEREFQGRLRIRWSVKRREWHIEERVGRGVFDPPRKDADFAEDRWVRAKDGYRFFGAVQAKPWRLCPACHIKMDVPHCQFKEVRCDYCGFRGLSGRLVLAYFPLGEALLSYLRKHDPLRDRTQANQKEIDLHNERNTLGIERAQTNARQDFLYQGLEATSFASAGFPSKAKDFEAGLLRE